MDYESRSHVMTTTQNYLQSLIDSINAIIDRAMSDAEAEGEAHNFVVTEDVAHVLLEAKKFLEVVNLARNHLESGASGPTEQIQ
jgi:hypothetical protein